MPGDILGQALLDYFNGTQRARLLVESSLGDREYLPVSYYFRDREHMPEAEKIALDACRGEVLDVGCGAGSHGLWLQAKGLPYTGLDLSEGAVRVCGLRGLRGAVHGDIWTYSGGPYQTLLLLMNGLGLAGNAARLEDFLRLLRSLVRPGGQLIGESADLRYLFDLVPGMEGRHQPDSDYYGNLEYELTYKGQTGEPFPWLYAGEEIVEQASMRAGWRYELLHRNVESGFLCRLTH